MSKEKYTFYVPWRKPISVGYILLWVLALIWLEVEISSHILFLVLLNILIPIVGLFYISTLVITENGIVLYRVNKLSWPDVTEAYKSKAFGINNIRVKRKKGAPWSIPLYMVGNTTIKEALLKYAPKNNKMHEVANEL